VIPLVLAATLSLPDAQAQALAHAPAVAEARARVSESEALVRAARRTGALHGIVNYTQAPQAGITNNSALQKLTTVGGQVSLTDLAGRDPAIAQAQAALRSALASELDAERAERIKVVGLYVEVQRAHEVRLLRESIAVASRADSRAAELRFAAGDAPRLDTVRADIARIQAETDLLAAETAERVARAAFASEIGGEAGALEVPALLRQRPAGLPTLNDALELALERRPEIAAAKGDLDAEVASLRGARFNGLGTLTVQAGYAYGVDTQINVRGPSANVTLDVPVGGSNAAEVAAQSARVDESRARLAAATQSVSLEVGAAYEMLAADTSALSAAAAARAEAEQEIRATQIGYRSGASSSLELIDARRTFAQALVTEVSARAVLDEALDAWPLVLGMEP